MALCKTRQGVWCVGPLLWMVLLAGCGKDESEMTPMELGLKIYKNNCQTCHLAQGQGVPGQQPRLVGSDVVMGDPQVLIDVIAWGSNSKYFKDQPGSYPTVMPNFGVLSERRMSALLTYIRQEFGHGSSAISEEQVRAARSGEN